MQPAAAATAASTRASTASPASAASTAARVARVAGNRGRELLTAVLAGRRDHRGIGGHRVEGMDEVDPRAVVDALERELAPRGSIVVIEAEHFCMSMRGVLKQGSSTVTVQFSGVFRADPGQQAHFYTLLRGGR